MYNIETKIDFYTFSFKLPMMQQKGLLFNTYFIMSIALLVLYRAMSSHSTMPCLVEA